MNKVFTVSIIGCGSRGCDAYGKLFHEQKERFKLFLFANYGKSALPVSAGNTKCHRKICLRTRISFFKKGEAMRL